MEAKRVGHVSVAQPYSSNVVAGGSTSSSSSSVWLLRVKFTDLLPRDELTPPNTPTYITVFRGTVAEAAPYLEQSSCSWIKRVSTLTFGPHAPGSLYRSTVGTADSFASVALPAREVVESSMIFVGGVYEFEPASRCRMALVCVARTESRTSTGSVDPSSAFKSGISARDAQCVILGGGQRAIASHLIPKRIGSERIQELVQAFGGLSHAESLTYSKWDHRIGILAEYGILDDAVAIFELGFLHQHDNTYKIQVYKSNPHQLDNYFFQSPIIHNKIATLTQHSPTRNVPFPPPYIFDWHWLQCIFKRFGGALTGPFWSFWVRDFVGSEADEDEDGNGDGKGEGEINPQYPSAAWDSVMRTTNSWGEEARVHQTVEIWKQGVVRGEMDGEDPSHSSRNS